MESRFSGIDFVYIGSGDFVMGNDGGDGDEKPAHPVKISTGFWMGKYEITQPQWKAVMKKDPSHFKGEDYPVQQVLWSEVQEFIKKMNKRACGRELDSEQVWREKASGCYRLPTEAEWEYATRAGTNSRFSFGKGLRKGQTATGRHKPVAVGKHQANPWGLHNVHGGVREWVLDWYDRDFYNTCTDGCIDPINLTESKYRVLRGGDWYSDMWDARSAARAYSSPEAQWFFTSSIGLLAIVRRVGVGFRLIKVL
jgi:formylglycine-generating enzyme required for sulfatase activity